MITENENTLLTTLQKEIIQIDKYLNMLGLGEKGEVSGLFEAKEAYKKKIIELLQKKYKLLKLSELIK